MSVAARTKCAAQGRKWEEGGAGGGNPFRQFRAIQVTNVLKYPPPLPIPFSGPVTDSQVPNRPLLDLTTLDVSTETPYNPMTAIPELSSRMTRRKLAGVLADRAPRGLAPDQLEEFRRRVVRGFYNSPAVQAEVARRMLESGDI